MNFNLRSWLKSKCAARLSSGTMVRNERKAIRRRGRPRLTAEALEDRCLPSALTITVTSLAGTAGTYNSGTQQATTLAAAIAKANTDNAGDTIVFANGLSGVIDLNPNDAGNSGAVGMLTLTGSMTIQGPSNNAITIEGGITSGLSSNVRVFQINSGTTVTLDHLVISNGYTSTAGAGGVVSQGTLTVSNSTISNNVGTTTGFGKGGGLWSNGTLTLVNSTISGNSNSSGQGGGVTAVYGNAYLTNVTVFGNSARAGGGIFKYAGKFQMTNVTVANNTSLLGGAGVDINWGPAPPANFVLMNSIISGNNGLSDFYSNGTVSPTSSNNIIERFSTYSPTVLQNGNNGNITGTGVTNAGLDPAGLQDNGGATKTVVLVSGSQAFDAGTDRVLSSPYNLSADQRGLPRLFGGHVDIGALEACFTISTGPTFNITHDAAGNFTANALTANINVADIRTDLLSGKNVTISSGPAGTDLFWVAGSDLDFNGIGNRQLNIGVTGGGSFLGQVTLKSAILDSVPGSTDLLSITVSAQHDLYIGGPLSSGSGKITLQADSDGSGVGTLTIANGASVSSKNTGSSGITLRGADIDIQSGGSVTAVSVTGVAFFGGNGPYFETFDAQGNLYFANYSTWTVSKVTPAGAVSTFVTSGLVNPWGLAFDAAGNLYVSNNGNNTVSKVTPQGVVSPFVTTGLSGPAGLAFDTSGNLYVANISNGTISKVTPAGAVTTFLSGFAQPDGLAFDSAGNLYVANRISGTISKVSPLGAVSTFAGGLSNPEGLAFGPDGNLFVGNDSPVVFSVSPAGAITPYITSGLNSPVGVAVDASGYVYVANSNGVSKYGSLGSVAVRSSQPSRPMSISGSDGAVAGINLTDAELARITVGKQGSFIVGDTSQSGNITFTTAIAPTSASTIVIQDLASGGAIILDDDVGGTPGVALQGFRGSISLTAGMGGILASTATNAFAELATRGSITLDTYGPIGSITNRVQIDVSTAPSSVTIGSAARSASGVFLNILGSVALSGSILTDNANLDVTSSGALTLNGSVASGGGSISFNTGTNVFNTTATGSINAGSGSVSIAADTLGTLAAAISGSAGISLQPASVGRSIGVNDASGSLQIPLAQLANLFTTTVTIGSATSGAINVAGNGATNLSAANFNLTLRGGGIAFNNTLTAPTNRILSLLAGAISNNAGAAMDVIIAGGTLIFGTSGDVGSTSAPLNVQVPYFGGGSIGGNGYIKANSDVTTTGNLTVAGALNLTALGSFTTHAGDLNNASVTFDGSNSQTLTTNSQALVDVTHTGMGTLRVADTLTAHDFTNGSGAGDVDISRRTVNISGNWSWSTTGFLTSLFSTVVLNGTNQSVSGNTNFYNLTKTVSAADTLTFEAGSTQVVMGTLTLQGAPGDLLALRSSNPGDQWAISSLGFRAVSYVDVQDGFNASASVMNAAHSADSGNDTNWLIFSGSSPNQTPVAANDTYFLSAGQVLNIAAAGLLLNDSDANGDTLTVDSTPAQNAAHGVLTLSGNGSFTYAPDVGYSGFDSFAYRVTDLSGASSIGFVNVGVFAVPPTVWSLSQTTVAEGAAGLTLTISGNNFLATSEIQWNGTPLFTTFLGSTQLRTVIPASLLATEGTAAIGVFNPGAGGGFSATKTFTVQDVTVPTFMNPGAQTSSEGDVVSLAVTATDADGSLPVYQATGLPPGVTINTATGLISGSIGNQAAGAYTVTVTATDGTNTGSTTFAWIVSDVTTPSLTPPGSQASHIGDAISLPITANDLDGDSLTFTAYGLPASLTINPATGVISGTLSNQSAGNYAVLVAVSDGHNSANTSFSWTVTGTTNTAPILSGVPTSASINDGQFYTFTAAATDSDVPVQTLTYSLVGAPSGASIDATTGVFTWTPTEAQGPDTYLFSVRVSDGFNSTDASITLFVREKNVAPVLSAPSTVTAVRGLPIAFTASATDADLINGFGNSLTFSLVNGPFGASIDPDTGAFTWTPSEDLVPGSYAVSVRVGDDGVPSLHDTKTISVQVVPAAIVSGDLVISGSSANDTITINPNANPAKVDVVVNGASVGTFDLSAITGQITVRGFAGNDKITVGSTITKSASLLGGSGTDTLTGGAGNDSLDGGAANDALSGGKGNDTYVFADGWGVDTVTEAAGAGTDSFDFSAATAGVVFSKAATISAKSGVNSVSGANIESAIGGNGNDALVSAAANTWNIMANNAGTLNATFSFSNIENLTGGASTDTVVLGDRVGISGNLVLGAGANTLNYSAYTTAVNVNLQTKAVTNVGWVTGVTSVVGGAGSDTLIGPNAATAWTITANDGGKAGAVAFSAFENLTGGTLNDTFTFSNGNSVSGTIDGGGGINTLNYAAYTTAVNVNLLLKQATAVANGISNIRNVAGGAANDILVGDANDNALNGNAGRNLLIGGAGKDTLNGGSGDDLLIAGTTSHDTNQSNLNAILAAWAASLPYATRILNLTGSGGLLQSSSLQNDGSVDTLTGLVGLDWFLAGINDIATDKNSGGAETRTSVV